MHPLEVSPDEPRTLVEVAASLATDYWVGIDSRPAAPQVQGAKKVGRFRCERNDAGIGVEVLSDFLDIAEGARTTHGRFFGYVFGSDDPVGLDARHGADRLVAARPPKDRLAQGIEECAWARPHADPQGILRRGHERRRQVLHSQVCADGGQHPHPSGSQARAGTSVTVPPPTDPTLDRRPGQRPSARTTAGGTAPIVTFERLMFAATDEMRV